MTQVFDYHERAKPVGSAVFGLIVLQTDETIEQEMRQLLPAQAGPLYASRIASAPDVTEETLARMEGHLTASAELLPPPLEFDVVGYGCTSGTSVIGPDRIAERIRHGCATKAVTEPLSALVAACEHLGVRRIAFLSPYVEGVSDRLRGALSERGVDSPVFGSFDEAIEAKVARIDTKSIVSAACTLAKYASVDAVFLSCTNLRTLKAIPEIEVATGKPALSSNQVLAWHMAQIAGVQPINTGVGCLFD